MYKVIKHHCENLLTISCQVLGSKMKRHALEYFHSNGKESESRLQEGNEGGRARPRDQCIRKNKNSVGRGNVEGHSRQKKKLL